MQISPSRADYHPAGAQQDRLNIRCIGYTGDNDIGILRRRGGTVGPNGPVIQH
jgi:hypothetical protein